jgi:hypothetical protein
MSASLSLPTNSKVKQCHDTPMEAKGGTGDIAPTHSALDEGEWSASRPGRALSRRKDPRHPLYRMLGGP